ncbi:MAG: NADH-quinone oxidoreductase subunit C, partial [Planctomycetes bacterium]|nr:NADH-quinone oxidoreductase subunit C [Planctomycetota bacterium]
MSAHPPAAAAHGAGAAITTQPIQPGLSAEQLLAKLAPFNAERDPRDRWGLTVIVPASRLREVVRHLRDDPELRFGMLLDVVGIDYLAFPDHRGARYAVTYPLKSLAFRHRVTLKVWIEEEDAKVPSLHDLFKSADWAERETWDQYGIVFVGHPNLKRLLNHHEFVGHPLRKDYPCQKRQKLSTNDPMVDQLEAQLKRRGYTVVERGEAHDGVPISAVGSVPLGDRSAGAVKTSGGAGAVGAGAPATTG